ncbi:MAG TPA: MFS transporter [Terriglobales bacterium]|nr:MFS transporter [Terriglobales bacterium]
MTFVTLGLVYGLWYAYSVFLVALLREFGWSRSLLAGAFSIFVLVHGLLSPGLGWLTDRIGSRRVVLAGGAILAGSLFLDGAVQTPSGLYLSFGVLTAIGVASAGWVPAVVLVQRWYADRVGLVIGAVSAGIGVGIFLVVPLCQFLIQAVGWRWAFRILGVLCALWILPATLWLLRDPPRARAATGMYPLAIGTAGNLTLGEAVQVPAFWLLGTVHFLGNVACQTLLVHQAAYLVDHKIVPLVAASVVSLVGLASVAGKAGGGWFSDRFGREVTHAIGMACVASSVGMLGVVALHPGPVPAYVYGALIGLGYSVTAALMPAIFTDVFRGRSFGTIFGTLQIATAIGGSTGPWLAGRVFDVTGSYALALYGVAGAAIAANAALWVARASLRRRPRLDSSGARGLESPTR